MKTRKNTLVRNYIILSLIVVLSIIAVFYFYMWHNAYEKERLGTSVASEYLNVIQYNELDNYLTENKDAIIYVSVVNDLDIRNFEKKFKRLVEEKALNNSILYMDITDELKSNKSYKEIKSKYSINVPYIIIFDNGYMESIYEIKENDYSISLLKDYLVEEGIIND